MFRRTFTMFACIAIATIASLSNASANEEAYNKTLRSTAWIIAGNMSGTAVVVDAKQRLLITNYHVTTSTTDVKVIFPCMRDGQAVSERDYYKKNIDKLAIAGKVVAFDKKRDLAIVQLERLPKGVVAIEFGKACRPGQSVHSIGNPGASEALWIYTFGKVRQNYYRKGNYDFGTTQMQMLETDAPINKGDSGGPIVNDEGQLVGISQGMSYESRMYSWGVDISEVRWYLKKYRQSVVANKSVPTKGTLVDVKLGTKKKLSAEEKLATKNAEDAKVVAGSFKDVSLFASSDK